MPWQYTNEPKDKDVMHEEIHTKIVYTKLCEFHVHTCTIHEQVCQKKEIHTHTWHTST